jgi:hypothetical protein
MYIVKHNYISWWYVYYTKALHVSAINVGLPQVVHEKLSVSYTKVRGAFIGCPGGGVVVGARSRFVGIKKISQVHKIAISIYDSTHA